MIITSLFKKKTHKSVKNNFKIDIKGISGQICAKIVYQQKVLCIKQLEFLSRFALEALGSPTLSPLFTERGSHQLCRCI